MAQQTDPTSVQYAAKRAENRVRRKNQTVPYESASPASLSKQPARAPVPRNTSDTMEWTQLRQHLEARLNMLRMWRYSWMEHWQLLETYMLPRRGIFINSAQPTPNTMIRGIPINQNIVDPTGTYAMRRCAAGMMSNLMSPSRPWFKLKPALFDRELASADAQEWFEEVEDRMYVVLSRSNFYDSGAQLFEDLVTFGTAPQIIYEDEIDLIRCYNPCCGEYYLSSSSANRVEALYRLYVMTTSQIVEMFGLENCPAEVQQAWQDKGGQLEIERIVAHSIEPNFPITGRALGGDIGVVPGDYAWREAYWVWGAGATKPLSLRGFIDQPHVVPRWATTSNDAYGRSVGMDVLPDVMQLQVETERKAEAIEKMVRPPMLASMAMKHEPSSVLPGKVTYVDSLDPGKGMRPMFTVNPEIKEMMEDLAQIQQRIKEGFYNDLFAMLETAANKQMTAYEVASRNQEKLQQLGPVVERWQNEYGSPAIKRLFAIMDRKGLLPALPKSLQGVKLSVEFVGMLAVAQKAASTAALERFAATMGNMQAADPTVSDLWSRDEWVEEYADGLMLSKRILNSPEKVASLRDARAKAAQQQQQAGAAQAAIQGAQTLSQTDVGGGANALSLMLGNSGGAGGGAIGQGLRTAQA